LRASSCAASIQLMCPCWVDMQRSSLTILSVARRDLLRAVAPLFALLLLGGCGGASEDSTPAHTGDAPEEASEADDEEAIVPAPANSDAGTSELENSDAGTAARCIADNPPSTVFDVGEDTIDSNADAGPRSAQSIAAECMRRGGTHCDSKQFISLSAAACIAQQEQAIPPGETARRVGLLVSEDARVEWAFDVYYPFPRDRYCSELLLLRIDAVSGNVLSSTKVTGCA
jgi:hypothetical protein